MRPCLIIAWQEIRDGLRNKWILAAALLLSLFALSITHLGSAPIGAVGASPLAVSIISLSSLTVFLLPLLGLLLSYDAVVGENERGTLLLFLSYPLKRWQFLAGKFLGQCLIIVIAVLIGYGVSGALTVAGMERVSGAEIGAYLTMMASSVLLGAAFIAIGYVISVVVGQRGAAGGLALSVWLGFVLIYDTLLLGMIVGDEGSAISDRLFNVLLLLNPTDAYRLLNLTFLEDVSRHAGITDIAGAGSADLTQSLASMTLWIVIPFATAIAVFSKKEL
ncbi:MAG: ABC transporter permease [Rhodospirillaceae bacterium]|jgi:Cu-processing system permease protein|nr:ABC transporter permease [Rhodospirillaceae bacterium]